MTVKFIVVILYTPLYNLTNIYIRHYLIFYYYLNLNMLQAAKYILKSYIYFFSFNKFYFCFKLKLADKYLYLTFILIIIFIFFNILELLNKFINISFSISLSNINIFSSFQFRGSVSINKKIKNRIIRKYNPLFCSYLSGLIDNDGCIYVPKTERNEKGRLILPSISIVFDIRDYLLAEKLKKSLGFGNLRKSKKQNACYLEFKKYEDIIVIVEMLNGYCRTNKIVMLYQLIDFLNNKFTFLNLIKKPLDSSSLDSNSWFSGFTDGDGIFLYIMTWRKELHVDITFLKKLLHI